MRSKTVTISSVYIQYIKKRELVNVYREDFQSILRKQRPKCNSTKVMGRGPSTNTRNLVIFSQESVKQKIRSLQQCASNGRNRFIRKLVLQKSMSSRSVIFIHMLSKLDHGAAEVHTFKLERQINLPVNKL